MNKNFIVPYLISSCLVFLSACTSNNEIFDCPAGKGMGCKSISEVNRMVDQGQFGSSSDQETGSLKTLAPIVMVPEDIPQTSTSGIERIPEQNLRLWIAPFQDEAGNFHEESAIHTVVRQGRWKLQGYA
ncbi:MAG: TraV family lipoprotein [Alphaproteobacteria bacterium]|nr:TraV family lipoprotein [Alphaproteobacteria bacterium]